MFDLVNTLADTCIDQYNLLGEQLVYGQHYNTLGDYLSQTRPH